MVELQPRGGEDGASRSRELFRGLVRALFRSPPEDPVEQPAGLAAGQHLGAERLAAALAAEGIDPGCRGEELSVEALARLAPPPVPSSEDLQLVQRSGQSTCGSPRARGHIGSR